MSWLASYLAPFVSHAPLAAWGSLAIASPIIIHLINRMRYRRVRFAAMEFLLASQQRNRRRLLLEQLLLLLLRILIVIGLIALIARLTLSPSQLSLFQGAQEHHVVVLDDSGSQQDRWGETTAWKESLAVVSELVKDGARRPNTQRFSLLLLSDPSQPVFRQEMVNTDFVTRLATKLESLSGQVKYRALDVAAGLDAARALLADDDAAMKAVHLVSDFRRADWIGQSAEAKTGAADAAADSSGDARSSSILGAAIRELDEAGVAVNLVRTVPERHRNLAITELSGDVHVAAAGVPIRLKLKVRNTGDVLAKDVRVTVFLDGQKLTQTIVFDKIDPEKDVEREFYVLIDQVRQHVVQVSLEADALAADNTRWLAIDVPPKNTVLIVDGDPSGEAGFFIAAGLAANPALTGFSPLVEGPDYLRRQPLHPFQCIYMVNVPELAADGLEPLKDYVADGGGLIWFVGDLVKPAFYNDKLYDEGRGLFPAPLGPARRELPPNDGTVPGPDIRCTKHPIFERDLDQDNPFIDAVQVSHYFPPLESWNRDDNERKDGVQTIATLRNRQPFAFEHTFGKGRVLTCLTTANDAWNNWTKNPSFPLTMLEMEKHVARRDRLPEVRTVGQAIELALDPVEYLGDVEVLAPAADVPVRLTAARKGAAPQEGEPPPEPEAEAKGDNHLYESFRDTEEPGVYTVALARQDDTRETRLFAYNAPEKEGELNLVTNEEIRERVGPDVRISIQEAGKFQTIAGRESGADTRPHLLALLAILLVGEQLMAYRLSYHPKPAAA